MNLIFIYMGLESTSISQCMTKNVKTIQSTESLFKVCKIMKDNKIGSVVVLNEPNDPVGIITERDIVINLSTEEANLRELVQNVMSKPLVILQEKNSIMDALQTMVTNNFRRLPILNKEENLVGIVTNKDIFKIIINNKGLLSDYYINKNFQPSYSILQDNKDQIFESFFKS